MKKVYIKKMNFNNFLKKKSKLTKLKFSKFLKLKKNSQKF